MKVALFQSNTECGMYAYTLDVTGMNLPGDFAPWKQIWTLDVPGPGPQIPGNQQQLAMLVYRALEHEGFSCVCSRSVFERLRVKNFTTVH